MIRHIVLFRFKPEADGRTKSENVLLVKKMLDALPSKISQIMKSETRIAAEGQNPTNADLLLMSDFESLQTLEEYLIHPDHKAVGAFMRPLRESREAMDITL